MSYGAPNPYESTAYAPIAASADEWERTTFIRQTYLHLAVAVGAFIMIEVMLFTLLSEQQLSAITRTMMGGQMSWLIVLGAFMGVSWLANSWAHSSASRGMQYAGLGLYVVAQAIIFLPLLLIASLRDASVIPAAGIVTGLVFAGLTALVFVTKANFSWLGKYLAIASLAALGFIVCSLLFGGFSLGIVFTSLMIALACGYILWNTSNIMHEYRTDQYVAASLALFASVALLFWYILRLFMARD